PKYGRKYIFIDLGLVGLFGIPPPPFFAMKLLTKGRRLYCSLNKRNIIPPLLILLPNLHLPDSVPARYNPSHDCNPSGEIRKPRPPALRLDTSNPNTIRSLHHLCDPGISDIIQGL